MALQLVHPGGHLFPLLATLKVSFIAVAVEGSVAGGGRVMDIGRLPLDGDL